MREKDLTKKMLEREQKVETILLTPVDATYTDEIPCHCSVENYKNE